MSPDHGLQRVSLRGFCGKEVLESSESPKAEMIKGH
jgi:hypothetical protein